MRMGDGAFGRIRPANGGRRWAKYWNRATWLPSAAAGTPGPGDRPFDHRTLHGYPDTAVWRYSPNAGDTDPAVVCSTDPLCRQSVRTTTDDCTNTSDGKLPARIGRVLTYPPAVDISFPPRHLSLRPA